MFVCLSAINFFVCPMSSRRRYTGYFSGVVCDGISLSKFLHLALFCNMGIKHAFPCINVCQVPRKMLKTKAVGRGNQHLPRDLANVNVLENNVDRCYCLKSTIYLENYLALYFVTVWLSASECTFLAHLSRRLRGSL